MMKAFIKFLHVSGFFFFFFLISCERPSFGPVSAIKGHVIDKVQDIPIEGAKIIIYKWSNSWISIPYKKAEVITDSDGYFIVKFVFDSDFSHEISLSCDRYFPKSDIWFKETLPVNPTYFLNPEGIVRTRIVNETEPDSGISSWGITIYRNSEGYFFHTDSYYYKRPVFDTILCLTTVGGVDNRLEVTTYCNSSLVTKIDSSIVSIIHDTLDLVIAIN